MKVKVLLNDGHQPTIIAAYETEHGIEFEDTLHRRVPIERVISYWTVETSTPQR